MNTVARGRPDLHGSAATGHASAVVVGPVIIVRERERDGESFQRNEKDSAFLPYHHSFLFSPLEVSAPLSRNAYLGRCGKEGGGLGRKQQKSELGRTLG